MLLDQILPRESPLKQRFDHIVWPVQHRVE